MKKAKEVTGKVRKSGKRQSKKNSDKAKTIESSSQQFDDIQRLVYLLQVHQVELEHQNEELRIAQEELVESRDKYVNLFDFSPVPYLTLNQEGTIKEVNLSASRMFGSDRKKLINKKIITQIVFEEREAFKTFIKTIFDTSVRQSCELKLFNKEKRVFEVLLEGVKLNEISGSEPKCQIAIIDLTEYKNIENSLIKSNERLKELSAIKEKFFSIIAHDLRNPFHSLLNFSELLATEIDSFSKEEIVKISQGFNKNLRNLYGLLENLLRWSMIQRDTLDINPISINLFDTVDNVIGILNLTAVQKNITISNDINSETTVYADYEMLRLVVQNLITNAIKFTKSGGQILVSAIEKNNIVEITVQDNGIGIDPKIADSLFRFNNMNSTHGTDGELGTGLGLPLCKEFICRNNGNIWVESEIGKGAKFTFTLPK